MIQTIQGEERVSTRPTHMSMVNISLAVSGIARSIIPESRPTLLCILIMSKINYISGYASEKLSSNDTDDVDSITNNDQQISNATWSQSNPIEFRGYQRQQIRILYKFLIVFKMVGAVFHHSYRRRQRESRVIDDESSKTALTEMYR